MPTVATRATQRRAPTRAPRRTLTFDEFLAACAALGDRPNPEQKAVVEAAAGVDLHVVAGPGTGKTASLVLRILKVVLVDGLRPAGVVATTFTVKAAAELRSRLLTRGFALVERVAADPALPSSVRERVRRLDINQITTNTVDGLCQSVLRDHREPGSNPPVIVDEFVASTLMLRAGLFEGQRHRDPGLDGYLLALNGGQRFGWNIGRKLGVLRTMWDRRFHDQVDWAGFTGGPGVPAAFADALAAYEAELSERHMVDFALLEQTVLDRLRVGGLATFTQGVQAVFVDEYQDTNLLQESLYFALARASGASLTIVGDDDQSLYRFRGATVDLFRDFPGRAARTLKRTRPRTVFLRRNYRSTPTIVGFVNAFAQLDPGYQPARVGSKPVLTARPGADEGAPVLGMFRADAATLAADLTRAIDAIFRGKGLRLPSGDRIRAAPNGDLGDAAVLCSSPQENAADGRRRLPGLLRDGLLGLPSPIRLFNPRGEEISAIPVVAEFGGLLLQVTDPDGTVEAAAAHSLGGAGAVFAGWRDAANQRLARGRPEFQRFHASLVARTPRRGGRWPRSVPMLKVVYGLLHYFPDLFDDPEGQIYLEVFTRQLAACAAISTYEGDLLAPPATPQQVLSAGKDLLRLFLAPIATCATGVNEELVEAFPRSRLAVLSIHQAKGLEFPLTIVDVGSDFRSNHRAHAFKRFPSGGGLPHALEDHMRPHSPLGIPTRTALDRAYDDLYRQFFVAFSRPEHALLLAGLDGAAPGGGIANVASGARRDGSNPWARLRPYVEI